MNLNSEYTIHMTKYFPPAQMTRDNTRRLE